MGQTAFTVRMDTEVKKRFDELCKDFGMSANTAFNMFARAVIKQERIPFEVESEKQAKLQRAWEAIERMRASVANAMPASQFREKKRGETTERPGQREWRKEFKMEKHRNKIPG